jgi:hypothetical protein
MFTSSNAFQVSVTTGWVELPPYPADVVGIYNNTGADLLIRTVRDLEANYNTIPNGMAPSYPVLANTSEILIKASVGASGVQVIAAKSKSDQ